ncbi:hypothetical protein Syun_025324 [Stephania yunnanensis]|uniref:KIB1-4 beta-propeller domain-containing protein n=1 Tax=Stephania yunnanensis TaxID=152371 RepID=A0AAP0HUU0_9MAGN
MEMDSAAAVRRGVRRMKGGGAAVVRGDGGSERRDCGGERVETAGVKGETTAVREWSWRGVTGVRSGGSEREVSGGNLKEGKLRVWSPLPLFQFSLPFVRVERNTTNVTIRKLIVSCKGPLIKNGEDVLVGRIYNDNKLACIRFGDKNWTTMRRQTKVHFVDQIGTVFICEENVHIPYELCHPIKAAKLIDHTSITRYGKQTLHLRYNLVEVEGELMLVIQIYISKNGLVTDDFLVFKLDHHSNEMKWKLAKKSDLEDYALFVNYCDGSMAAKLVYESSIFFKTVDESQSDISNHKVMVSDYMEKYYVKNDSVGESRWMGEWGSKSLQWKISSGDPRPAISGDMDGGMGVKISPVTLLRKRDEVGESKATIADVEESVGGVGEDVLAMILVHARSPPS